jgi:hypothetical protein
LNERAVDLPENSETTRVIFCDGCEKGWGAIEVKVPAEGAPTVRIASGGATRKTWKHSSVSEPWALVEAEKAFHASQDHTTFIVDNEALMHAITRGHARSWHYNESVRRLAERRYYRKNQSLHIPGEHNPADPLSRGDTLSARHISNMKTWARTVCLPEAVRTAILGIPEVDVPYRIGVHPLASMVAPI